jgi:hypothetical protein
MAIGGSSLILVAMTVMVVDCHRGFSISEQLVEDDLLQDDTLPRWLSSFAYLYEQPQNQVLDRAGDELQDVNKDGSFQIEVSFKYSSLQI